MRVLFCNYEYPPLGGGGGVVTALLAETLARRHEVTVLTSRGPGLPAEEVRDGVRVLRVAVPFRQCRATATVASMFAYMARAPLVARRRFARGAFELVNTHFVLPSGPAGQNIARWFGVPNVLSLHGGDLYDPSKPLSPHRHRPLRMWVRHLLHAADHLVGQSADTIANAHRYYDPELPVSRISLSIRRPEVVRANRADYGFGAHDRLLVTIGRLVTRKAVDQLIALLDRLPATTGFWSSAPAPRRRSSAVRRPRPGSRTGSTSSASSRSAEARDPRDLSDLFVSTSQHEGFGLVFLEAMASGLPVVCYDRGGQTDFLESGAVVDAVDVLGLSGRVVSRSRTGPEVACGLEENLGPSRVAGRKVVRIDWPRTRLCRAPEGDPRPGGRGRDMALRDKLAAGLARLAGTPARQPPVPDGALRVLLVSYEYPPLGGGGAKVVRGLATELVRAGHQVDVITTGRGGLPAEECDEGVRVTRLRTLRRRADRSSTLELGVWVGRALPAVLRRLAGARYDAINAHFILPDGLVCALACAALGRRFVVTAHGSDVPGYNADRFQLAHRLLGRVWRRLVQAPACIVFPSEHLMALARRQEVPFKACVIPNGFDASLRSARGERRPRILVATRLFRRKGVQHLILAHAQLDEEVELHVIGDGPYRAPLEELARTYGKPVVFHGWVENLSEPFNELMSGASVFAFPSEAENFPVCLLEAMAFELPVVTSSGTGCEAVIGEAGLLVPPGDVTALTEALRRLIRSPALRAELGRAGRRRLEANFTWPAVARRYAELYAAHPTDPTRVERHPAHGRADPGILPFGS